MKLKGSRCIVTGASSGIGMEVAKRLLEEGATVCGAALDSNFPKALTQQKSFIPFSGDLSRPDQVDALFDQALQKLGDIDLFFANAGFAYCEQLDTPDWAHIERIYQINVFSAIYALEKLRNIKGKQNFLFLATASGMSLVSMPHYALYSSTKAALHGFAASMRYEMPKNQVLSLVYPISTKTRFFQQAETEKIPWPAQDVEIVADKIIRGIPSNKRAIFPSLLFRLAMILFTFAPWARKWYCKANRSFDLPSA